MSDEANNAPEAAAKADAPINIWLVDDNKNIRRTMMELLNACEGIQCQVAFHSPNAVLSTLASKPGPDVILLDIQMGEACGLDAIRPIKALSRSTQVLMFTSCTDGESKRRALTSGATGFLLKQFPLERIIDGIHKARQNPAPHLKQMPKTGPPPASVTFPTTEALPAKRDPQNPAFGWLRHCLSYIQPWRN